jgi:SAM-dependent methyltransferase
MDHRKPIIDGLSAEDWAGEMGERWLVNLDRFESMIAPVGDALLARAGLRAGERVVDIGCGGGATSREIARRVQPGGTVVGVDISAALVAEAARRAASAGLTNAAFVVADAAAALPPGAPFDRLVSRFGSMFFANPATAFQNLDRMLRTGARADFAVWAPARENAWVAGLMGVVGAHMEIPAPVPRAPGPFAFDDPEYFRAVLEEAGFRDLQFQRWEGQQLIGGAGADPADAVRFVLNAMSFGALVQEQPPALRAAVETELTALFAAHRTPAGIAMGANVWLVSASAG